MPGSGLPIGSKTIVYQNDHHHTPQEALDREVALYPITPALIRHLHQPAPYAQRNPALEAAKAAYVYRVGSGDVLNINVWLHPNLNSPAALNNKPDGQVSNGTWVDESGYITYPLIGRIFVKGKTLHEIQNLIQGRLKRYIKQPQVAVNITEFRSQKVAISGAVKQPGQLALTNTPLTLLDAVSQAGGLLDNADTHHIIWTHQGQDHTLSLQNLLANGNLSTNVLLSDGDVVYVPTQTNSEVYVMGEVGRQTTLPISNHGLTLTQAISNAGGMNQTLADATGVFVIRNMPDDAEHSIHVYQLNLKDATAYALGNRFTLQSRDVVYVTAAPVTRWNRVVSQITGSISSISALDSTFK